ncbi:hypothetical protein PGTUg99_004080 [Puccinia graminis f. sp. tritici]|uniref:Uncharacterized protein n=1 Tax=Puccinia graminis f. sp. tritici TaxID=56615 RepID=A0A5B0NIY6_PUCGR|nr:hypothetical protein PGTUg99_004080 [Puccinia graminis f. sp. tritici]
MSPGTGTGRDCEATLPIFDHPDRPYHLASQDPLARPKTAARRSYFQVPHMLWSSLYHLLCDWVKGFALVNNSSRAHHQKSLSSLYWTTERIRSGRRHRVTSTRTFRVYESQINIFAGILDELPALTTILQFTLGDEIGNASPRRSSSSLAQLNSDYSWPGKASSSGGLGDQLGRRSLRFPPPLHIPFGFSPNWKAGITLGSYGSRGLIDVLQSVLNPTVSDDCELLLRLLLYQLYCVPFSGQ